MAKIRLGIPERSLHILAGRRLSTNDKIQNRKNGSIIMSPATSPARDCVACGALFILAALSVYLQGPGYLLWGDSFVKWEFAKAISQHGFGYPYNELSFTNWHPTFPIVLMAATLKLSGGMFLFSALQSTLLSLGTYAVLRRATSPYTTLALTSILFLIPTNIIYSVTHTPEPLMTAFAIMLIGALLHKKKLVQKYGIHPFLIIISILFITTVWIRPNFAICAPIIAFFAFTRSAYRLLFAIALLGTSISLLHTWDKLLNVNSQDVSVISMAAEIVGISKMTNGATCDTCLDFIGNTESARQNYRHEDAGYMLWEKDGGLTPEKVALIENTSKIRKLWWHSVTSAPLEFIEMKSIKAYWLYSGNSPTATTATPMTTNWAGVVSEVSRTEAACNCQVGPLRDQAAQLATNIRLPALEEKPLLGLVICLALIASSLALPPQPATAIRLLACTSILYYAGFLLNMQRVEFRYYYPSWMMMLLAVVIFLQCITSTITTRVKHRYALTPTTDV